MAKSKEQKQLEAKERKRKRIPHYENLIEVTKQRLKNKELPADSRLLLQRSLTDLTARFAKFRKECE